MFCEDYNTMLNDKSSKKKNLTLIQSTKNNIEDCRQLLSYMEKNLNDKQRFRKPKNRMYTSDTSIMTKNVYKRKKKPIYNHSRQKLYLEYLASTHDISDISSSSDSDDDLYEPIFDYNPMKSKTSS